MISVIIPVYNSEKYIAECLNSILAQTYKDLEIILVDDGSTDGSAGICEDYVRKDNRIKLVRQENGGSTKARKTGLEVSQGEYISFVDSDDWLDDCFYENLYGLLTVNDADMIVSGCCRESKDSTQVLVNRFADGLYKGAELEEKVYPKMMYYSESGCYAWGILQYLWNKIFKREVIEPCIYTIDSRIYDGEDVACVFDACLRADSIYVDNHAYYHYRIHENSICTMERGENYFINGIRLYNYMRSTFSNMKNGNTLLKQLPFFMNMFMNNGAIAAFGCGYQPMYSKDDWSLPSEIQTQSARVCIYGAGKVGTSFYTQLVKKKEIEVIAWVDSRAHGQKIGLVTIEKPEVIFCKAWDYILVAVQNEKMAGEIKEWLIKRGVEPTRIIWEQPKAVSVGYQLVKKDLL